MANQLFKRIKDWAVSITSFRTGDVIPVDGPSGTAKMPYSDLAKEVIKDSANNPAATEADLVAASKMPIITANGLKALPGNTITSKTYAQNVANSIAPEFDPTRNYVVGESCTYEGTAYIFTSDHPAGAWNPAHATISGQNALLRLTAQNALAGNVATAFDPTRDNTNPYKVGDIVSYNGKIYSFKNSHYGAWNSADAVAKQLDAFQSVYLDASNVSSYNDVDNYPRNSSVRCTNPSLVSQISHLPVSDQFAIYTYSSDSILYQICILAGSKHLHFRRKWGTWSDWTMLADAGKTITNVGIIDSTKAQSSPYNDLDTIPNNEIIFYTGDYIYVSNIPSRESFQAITLGGSSGVKLQIVTTSTKKIFVRSYWNPSWSSWISLDSIDAEVKNLCLNFSADFSSSSNYNLGDIICRNGALKKAKKPISSGGSFTDSDWSDVNIQNYKATGITADNISYLDNPDKFPSDSIIVCLNSALASQVSNIPESAPFTCYSFKGSNAVIMQVFISGYSNELYFRRKWATWSNWRKFAFVGDIEPDTPNPLYSFDNIVAVGDSLTWCQVYTGVNTSRQAKKLWCDMLAHSCDATAQTIAVAGDTAKTSWPRVDANLTAKTNALIIVYLGTNGGLTDTLATDAPTTDPYTDWADTNTGCYAKIVAKAQSLGYKVLLIKPWTGGGGDLDTTNSVIEQIGARFGCCVVGPFKTKESKYHYYPDLSGSNTLHYNDLGYAWFATALPYYVSRAENAQLKYIIPS